MRIPIAVLAPIALLVASGCQTCPHDAEMRRDGHASRERGYETDRRYDTTTSGTYDTSRTYDTRDTTTSPDANNTSRNERDRNDATLTPFDQGTSESDVKRTADIRKRVVNANVSIDAQNVKIITRNGRVLLRGPVKTQAERDLIDGIARDVAGGENVDDRIEVEVYAK